SAADRRKLLSWRVIEEIDKAKILEALQKKRFPMPKTWRHLLGLWAYIAPELTRYLPNVEPGSVRIVPVQGKDALYAPAEGVHLGERKLLQSDADWEFLDTYLLVLNQNWPRFLADERRAAIDQKDRADQETVEAAYAILKAIGLDDTSDVNKVIDRVAAGF